MKNLSEFLLRFYHNQGLPVLGALIVGKLSAFLLSILLVRSLSVSEFGIYSLVPAVFILFATFTGFGLPVGLLRFGSVLQTVKEKEELSAGLFLPGLLFQLGLSVIFLMASFFFRKYEGVFVIFLAFSVRLMGFYLVSFIQSNFRMRLENKKFSSITIFWNIAELIAAACVLYFFGLQGFLIVMAISPFLVLFSFEARWFNFKNYNKLSFRKIFNYSIHASATNLLGELLFTLDLLLIGFLLTENAVAEYKIAILIPSNIAFLAVAFLQADFPKIAARYKDADFLKNYIANFFRLFLPVGIILLIISFFFGKEIIGLVFGEKYVHMSSEFFTLMCIFALGMLTRTLFGNIFAAVGKTAYNSWLSLVSVLLMLSLGSSLVPIYGIEGMIWSLGVAFLVFAVGSTILFTRYLKSIR